MKTIHKKNTTFLNLAAGLLVAALVLGCNTNVSNGSEVQPEKFTVTFNVNGGNGKLTATVDGKAITSPVQVEKDKTVIFTATPHNNYAVDKWSITPSNALIENGKAEDTTAKVKVTENTTVNVTFKSTAVQPPTPPVTDGCTVTMSAGANGSITADPVIPAGGKVAKDTEITFTATANPGYRVDTWTVTPAEALIQGGQAGNTTAKVKVTANTTVNVTFKAIKYPVAMTHGEHGDITANMSIPAEGIDYGTEITFTATANPGYRVDTWTVTPTEALIADGQQGDTTAKVKVTANTTVNVTFKAIKYPVAMTHGEHGNITANMSIPAEGIDYGTEITFTATANPGYRVDTWTVTPTEVLIADGQQEDTTAKVKVTANTTVNVTFKPIVYTPVAYADLHNHLTTAQPETNSIYYIEVTGLTALDVKGDFISDSASPLGQILNNNRQKKVALKFGTMPYVTDMKSCFNGCTSLVQVSDIPNSVTDMSYCFKDCTKLEQIPNIPNSVTDMSWCFNSCTSLVQVSDIPNSVTDMSSCFNGCTKLEQIPNIPNSVTDMRSCFSGCTKLEQIPNIPNSVTNMSFCFNGCTKLEQIPNIPNSVTDMSFCFNGCTKLERVPNIPNSVTDMSSCFNGCTKLEQIPNIPNSVTDMSFCFNGCTKLERVPNIPNSVTNMSYCFNDCTKLERVPNIPDSVTNMSWCFNDCTKLERVPNIPDSVTDMRSCFNGCTSLTSVTLKCGYIDGKFNYAFDGCSSLSVGSIKVPADSLDRYKDNADKMKAKAEWFAKDE
ncbi:leucine-rich repeat protein [Treponema vincentii]|uniref:InlB B-repeat-containing protein n=1 Tax=Treponema vincentii TaxID=69710 RepID=UPI0035F5EF70